MFSVRGKGTLYENGFPFQNDRGDLNSSKLEDTKRLYEIVASVKSGHR